MTNAASRSAFAIALRHCLRRAALPAIGATIAATVGAAWFAPALREHEVAPGAMTSWLGLPLLVVAAVACGAVIVLWPAFTVCHRNDDRGTDWVLRLQRGPLRGSGAVVAGALAAQLALTLPMTTWLARAMGAPAVAFARQRPEAPALALLDRNRPRIEFELPGDTAVSAIELRPLAAMPGGPLTASRLQLRGDGEVLTTEAITFHQSGQLAAIGFAPRTLRRLSIELVDGNVPLFFPDGAVIVIEHAGRSGLLNGAVAAVLYLVPTFLALAFACLCGSVAATPTVMTVAMVLLFLGTTAGLGPGSQALLGLLRGHWLPGAETFASSAPSLAAGCGAMIVAMLLRRRPGS